MELSRYHDLAMRTAKVLPSCEENFTHAALGLASEFFESLLASNDELELFKELGDMAWYFPVACDSLGIRLEDLPALAETYDPDVDSAEVVVVNLSAITSRAKRFFAYGEQMSEGIVKTLRRQLANLWVAFSGDLPPGCLEANIEKLRVRFPDAYSNEAALARADVGGAAPEELG